MCGIIGIVSHVDATDRLISALRRLEYRGYDSTGVALVDGDRVERRRAKGKLVNLENLIQARPIKGCVGMGHTRWATHGAPSDENAHPHGNEHVAVVHNGIIENHDVLRQQLLADGCIFEGQTDTEVVVHLLLQELRLGQSPMDAFVQVRSQLKGAFAIVVVFAADPDRLYVMRDGGSPLCVGFGEGEMFAGSDAIALAGLTRNITYLEEGDWAVIEKNRITIYDRDHYVVEREIKTSDVTAEHVSKLHYDHFMQKEIFEQPSVVQQTLQSLDEQWTAMPWSLKDTQRLTISACGTAYYAGFVAKYWMESLARLGVDLDIASEFRYRMPPMVEGGTSLFVSQSGETIDTMAALHYARSQNQKILAVVNVKESAIDRACDFSLHTKAGTEVGVASTKGFTTQLTVLAGLAVQAAFQRGHITSDQRSAHDQDLRQLPILIQQALTLEPELKVIAAELATSNYAVFLGRGTSYPVALEGALKLKEITYIHSEAYAAGELKHGPMALIDETVPVFIVAPFDHYFEKTASNIQEVAARGGNITVLTDQKGAHALQSMKLRTVVLPNTTALTSPIVYTIPLQLLAYHTGIARGTDVDQPRNLAKSVTVE